MFFDSDTFCKVSSSFVFQVDLLSPKKITGIITQGAKDFGCIQFVTAFKVALSDDGRTWTTVKDNTTRNDRVGPTHVHRMFGRYKT